MSDIGLSREPPTFRTLRLRTVGRGLAASVLVSPVKHSVNPGNTRFSLRDR